MATRAVRCVTIRTTADSFALRAEPLASKTTPVAFHPLGEVFKLATSVTFEPAVIHDLELIGCATPCQGRFEISAYSTG